MSDKPEKIEWRELDWCYCGLVGGTKFYLIQRKVYTEPELHNTVIIEILETGKWWEFDTVKEAKAKAEELLTEWLIRADIAKPSEWISVDDRLPKENQDCLVYYNPNSTAFPFARYMTESSFYDGNFEAEESGCSVTHWQPLPPPPTKTP